MNPSREEKGRALGEHISSMFLKAVLCSSDSTREEEQTEGSDPGRTQVL